TLAAKAARPPTTMQITVALSLLLISLSVVLSAAIPSEDEYAAALQRRFMEDIRRQGAMVGAALPRRQASSPPDRGACSEPVQELLLLPHSVCAHGAKTEV
ncbi:hypothetical protein PFISCL1PPCAC_29021, partial [Pristionchus fissidentatus]